MSLLKKDPNVAVEVVHVKQLYRSAKWFAHEVKLSALLQEFPAVCQWLGNEDSQKYASEVNIVS